MNRSIYRRPQQWRVPMNAPSQKQSIFLRIAASNNGSNADMPATFSYFFDKPVLENMEGWQLAVHRLAVPTQRISHVVMDDQTNYFVAVRPFWGGHTTQADTTWSPGYLPVGSHGVGYLLDDNSNTVSWLYDTQVVDGDDVRMSDGVNLESFYNTNTKMVHENINRAITRAYLGMLWSLEYSQSVHIAHSQNQMVATKTFTAEPGIVPGTGGQTYPIVPGGGPGFADDRRWVETSELESGYITVARVNMKPTEAIHNTVPTWGKIAGVILRMQDVGIRFTVNRMVSPGVYNIFTGDETFIPFTYVLEDPSGTRIPVGYSDTDHRWENVWVSDGSTRKPTSVAESLGSQSIHTQPITSLGSLHDNPWMVGEDTYATANATWKLLVYSPMLKQRIKAYGYDDDPSLVLIYPKAFDATLHAFPSYGNLPTLPAQVASGDKKMALFAQRAWLDGNMSLAFSPRLRSLLSLDDAYFSAVPYTNVSGHDTMYELVVGGELIAGASSTDIIEINDAGGGDVTPEASHTNIRSIELATASFPILAELQATDLINNDTLMSFLVENDALSKSQLIYSYDGPDKTSRRFPFSGTGPLERMSLTVYVVYTNGVRKVLQIAPDEYAEIVLQLVPPA